MVKFVNDLSLISHV